MGLLNYNTLRPFSNQSGLPRLAKLYKERNGNIKDDIHFGKMISRTFQYQPSDSPEFWKDGGNLVDYTEDEMLYTVNEHGFRGKKIIQTDSILMTAGCSHTYGIGVNNAEVWGSNLADELDMYHINTGIGGIGPDTVALLIKFPDQPREPIEISEHKTIMIKTNPTPTAALNKIATASRVAMIIRGVKVIPSS